MNMLIGMIIMDLPCRQIYRLESVIDINMGLMLSWLSRPINYLCLQLHLRSCVHLRELYVADNPYVLCTEDPRPFHPADILPALQVIDAVSCHNPTTSKVMVQCLTVKWFLRFLPQRNNLYLHGCEYADLYILCTRIHVMCDYWMWSTERPGETCA